MIGGGAATLDGEVVRVDPFGISKFSALGVEEQRVSAVIRLTSPPEAYAGLGDGFRVEARIVVWEDGSTLIVPASALFRDRGEWAVFRVEDGGPRPCARSSWAATTVSTPKYWEGLETGDTVVLFPSSGLSAGMEVTQRVVN